MSMRKTFAILDPIRGLLARNDVVQMTNGEALHINPALPRILETFDAIGSKHQVQIKGSIP